LSFICSSRGSSGECETVFHNRQGHLINWSDFVWGTALNVG
jgi:hypothetical protein